MKDKLKSVIFQYLITPPQYYDSGKALAEIMELVDEYAEEYEEQLAKCDVKGCSDTPSSGGMCWRKTGYWNVCSKHFIEHQAGKPQPEMKPEAIEREKARELANLKNQSNE